MHVVRTMQILVQYHVVARTVLKSSAHNADCQLRSIEVIMISLNHDAQIQTSKMGHTIVPATCCRSFFGAKMSKSQEGKICGNMSLLHVP